jgi:hypothetical protein
VKKRPMMINRRKTLLAMAAAWGAGVSAPGLARLLSRDQEPAGTSSGSRPGASAGDPVEQSLREDLARLGSREYSDEGIPVFLACEDLVAAKTHRHPPPPSAWSQTVAADLRKNGEAWLRIFPKAPDTDISKLIELLAERDFSGVRRGKT